jgi:two-component system alkaline phosphatase synthesis response regulator PhoP
MTYKILIVDDERVNTALVKFSLAQEQYQVVTAQDGEEGLSMAQKEKPDLIILDIQMPKMNGYEFMEELRKNSLLAKIPVLMMTANETLEDLFKLEGVKGYFVKPVKMPELISKIRQCLGEDA